jgi:hypothetical protein
MGIERFAYVGVENFETRVDGLNIDLDIVDNGMNVLKYQKGWNSWHCF